MWIPLSILAAFAFAIGYALHVTAVFHEFLAFTPSLATEAVRLTPQPGVFHINVAITSTIVAVVGLLLSAFFYLGRSTEARALATLFSAPILGAPYLVAKGKFFWDEIYDLLIVGPCRGLANLCYGLDRWVVDGLVNLVGWVPKAAGIAVRGLQMGFIPFYALAMVLGALSLVAAKVIWGGM
jgi:hypothetical protein